MLYDWYKVLYDNADKPFEFDDGVNMKLLADQKTNTKLGKNTDISTEYNTSILYLAPADEAGTGVNMCPASTPGCRASCLFTSGRGRFESVREARIKKTQMLVDAPELFLELLLEDLEYLVRIQNKTQVKQAVRLNGTSDVLWESIPVVRNGQEFEGIPQAFPELMFYDYTKVVNRPAVLRPIANYNLTISAAEYTSDRMISLLIDKGFNVSKVFRKELPETYLGHKVIDGTLHDMRFLDDWGVIVGLVAKGQARKDTSGFVD
jgi:hypothetical protein